MKQLYVANLCEHKFLVNEANRPHTLSNILGSVLGKLPGFCRKQNNTLHSSKEMEEQSPTIPEASTIDFASTTDNLTNGKTHKEGNGIETIAINNVFLGDVIHSKDNTSDIVDFPANVSAQNDTHSSDLLLIHTETML